MPLRVLIPNLLTLFGLALGLTAIRFSYEDRVNLAVIAVVAAAGLDGLDGRVARLLRGTSRFGAELDSLADFVNFGVAPALILYGTLLHAARSLGWLAALVFATAMALRLARFNVALDDLSRPDWKKNFFTGVPAPAGAITGMLPLYLLKLGFGDVPGFVPFSVGLCAGDRLPDGERIADLCGQDARHLGHARQGAFRLPGDRLVRHSRHQLHLRDARGDHRSSIFCSFR